MNRRSDGKVYFVEINLYSALLLEKIHEEKKIMPTELKMTERQKYLFDLQGFLVVENVLTMEECDLEEKEKLDEFHEDLDVDALKEKKKSANNLKE